jgi:cell division protein ZapA
MSESGGPSELISIRVRVLDREYPLRVAPGDEDYTIHLAQRVDERMQALRHALPTQPDLTHAVLAALELAEELFAARAARDQLLAKVEVESGDLIERLTLALSGPENAA